jgi:uncharacterized protein YebE (UPF0316 family)
MFSWAVFWVCVQIFLCRILDVSLGTVRMVLTVKEKTVPAAAIGFIEVTVWFLVVREALTTGSGLVAGFAYAGGFAAGTLIGGIISKRFIKGNVVLQIVTAKNDDMVCAIQAAGFGVSVINVNSTDLGEEKYMLFCDINKSRLVELKDLIHKYEKGAFIMVQENKQVYNGFIK